MSFINIPYAPSRPSRLRESIVAQDEDLHNDFPGQYLTDLRSQRLARPSGSRPPPPSKFGSLKRAETAPMVVHEPNSAETVTTKVSSLRRTETTPATDVVSDDRPSLPSSNSMPSMSIPRLSHRRADSDLWIKSPFAGRPLARSPSATSEDQDKIEDIPRKSSRPVSVPYMENGMRWMEKQEARSLRLALEDMDIEKDKKVHEAAQDEAAELVWKHQNPGAAFANPDAAYANPDAKRDYRSHLRKGSYTRSHSQEQVPLAVSRKACGGSQDVGSRKVSPPMSAIPAQKNRSPSGKSYGGLAEAVEHDIAKAFRRTSGGNKRIMSGDKSYMNKHDRIWEDPEEGQARPQPLEAVPEPTKPAITPIQPPSYVRKNPFARVRVQQQGRLEHSTSAPVLPVAKHNSIDIQRNPPSQSRKAWYTANEPMPPTPPSSRDEPADEVAPKSTPTKDGIEVRGDDIRAATSKQRKDRSPRLPQPTLVSDKPGRPIVSFKQDMGPKEVVLKEVHTEALPEPFKPNGASTSSRTSPPNMPSIQFNDASAPPIPTIICPDDPEIPSIVLPEEPDFASTSFHSQPPTPSVMIDPRMINISCPEDAPLPLNNPSRRPLPVPTRPGLPHHAATTPVPMASTHRTVYTRQSGTLCAHCALPIAGRILSAAGERFHPKCFVCHQCHTNLECVAFYPEPDQQRAERVARIQARSIGAEVPGCEDLSEEEYYDLEARDGDPSLRFYCHLDFHELYSPRCKSCKTPIEGEVIVACGAEWHAGHFFCAQCGDPFDSSTPFVEKDGYAWCVNCHTNRYSSKCRKCKKPVTDLVVKALGSDWHDKCFVCMECNGEFDDGRYFLRGESRDPVCVRCEERRLKA